MNIIDSYQKLPIGKYMDICAISESGADELTKQVKIISLLTDMPEDDVLRLPIAEYKSLVPSTRFLASEEGARNRVAKVYKLGKWELLPVQDYRKLTTGQYVDFQSFAPLIRTHMAEFLSVLLVPKGKQYNDGYDIIEVQQAIRTSMCVADAMSLCAFFLLKYRQLIADTLNCCIKALSMIKDRKKRRKLKMQISTLQELLN